MGFFLHSEVPWAPSMHWPAVDADHLLVRSDQMLELEQQWLSSGLPVAALMETVGQRMAEWCLQRPDRLAQGVLVLVGPGHNGCDGLVLGRKLLEKGIAVRLWAPLPLRQALTHEHWRHLLWLGVPVQEFEPDPADPSLWIDALFGLGQTRPLPDQVTQLLQQRQLSAPGQLISLDCPAGLDSDSGTPLGTAVAVASDTLTVALIKRGLVQDAALPFAGKVHRIDPGVPPRLMASLTSPLVFQVGASDLKTLPVPAEKSTAMKYERGRLLLIAGSERYRGAAHLAVRGALASGAGSVRAALPKVVDQQLWQWAPEVVSEPALESDDSGSLLWGAALERSDLSRLDALLLGPGLGLMEGVWRGWAEPLQTFRGLLVLDADALNQLSGDVEGWRWFLKRMGPTWITPHPQEFERLFPFCDQGSPLERAAAAAERSGVVVLLKGAHSVIADPSGSVRQLVGTDCQVARTGLGDLLAGLAGGWGARLQAAASPADGAALAAAGLLHAQAACGCSRSSGALTIADQLTQLVRSVTGLSDE